MTPIEKMRAEMEAERAAKRAASMALYDFLEHIITAMPDGPVKRNGQIVMLHGKIMDRLESLTVRAAERKEDAYNEEQSQQVLDYLSCVYGGLCEFCKQIGLEVSHG